MLGDYNILYKFSSLEIAETILLTSTLRFSNPSRFNDPFDCDISRVTFEFPVEDTNVKREIEIIKTEIYPNLNFTDQHFEEGFKHAQIDKIKRSSVCCFSRVNDNLLLWAHYANKHLGACLVFDNTVLDKFENIPTDNLTQVIVEYKNFEPANYFKDQILALKTLFGTKSADWSYEEEFRLILLAQEGLFKFKPNFLKGIIFGLKVSDQEIARIRTACTREKINVFFKKAIRSSDQVKIIEVG